MTGSSLDACTAKVPRLWEEVGFPGWHGHLDITGLPCVAFTGLSGPARAMTPDVWSQGCVVQVTLYGALVLLCLLGNSLVLLTVLAMTVKHGTMAASDLLLANLSTINLLLTVLRNTLIFAADLGLQLSLSATWCRVFMFTWVLLRAMSTWATSCLSIFHCRTIRKQHPLGAREARGARDAAIAVSALWMANVLYSLPALVYSSHVAGNTTLSPMLVSSTTRPLLGCTWAFPSQQSGMAYVTASLVIQETVPAVLMLGANVYTLHKLKGHVRAMGAENGVARFASERRAAKVIMALVVLFVGCWGTNTLAVGYHSFTSWPAAPFLLQAANFCTSLFLGMSSLIILAGHSQLRRTLRRMICAR
ncbi:olfactory receptor class A-like protein 4 [Trachemys scripta elegans]|uniref:olfactory receptor class A-like protein 4 n=1 Tax=Trachemys scripta elegans TaxID=31138 RepID=UPI001553A03B|nr:olfactory receptor class A-like protein 4 [Trachemys scripta elegans]